MADYTKLLAQMPPGVVPFPRDIRTENIYGGVKVLRKAGIVPYALPNDPGEYWRINLPEDWQLTADTGRTDVYYLIDHRQRQRATVFAQYHGPYAKMRCRFEILDIVSGEDKIVVQVRDGEKVIYNVPARSGTHEDVAAARRDTERWLSRSYPRYRHPDAYWEE